MTYQQARAIVLDPKAGWNVHELQRASILILNSAHATPDDTLHAAIAQGYAQLLIARSRAA